MSIASNVIGWLRAGYPNGVPEVDYMPLFALLGSHLTDDEVQAIADALAADGIPSTAQHIQAAIHAVTKERPLDVDMARVAARLAAGGWPLADVRSLAGFRRRFQCGAARAGCEGRLSCPPSSGRPGRRRRCRGLGSNHSAPCAGTAGGSPRRSRTRRPGRSRW
jgi:hypothetical protein